MASSTESTTVSAAVTAAQTNALAQQAVSTAAAVAASAPIPQTPLAPNGPFVKASFSSAVPRFFQNTKLRRGKWLPKEERYAEYLIQQFELGALEECENGCTLRAYLSRKLHCAPMRISKKYAGKKDGS